MILVFLLLIYGIKKNEQLQCLEIEQANVLRGIACLYILLCHCNMYFSFDSVFGLLLYPYNAATILSNGLFFFISGYGLWKSSNKKENYLSMGNLLRRLKQLVVPAAIVFILSNIMLILEENRDWISIFTIQNAIRWFYYNDVTWFILEIFFLYILFWGLFSKIRKKYANYLIILFIVVWDCLAIYTGRGIVWYASTLCFAVGILMGQMEENSICFSEIRCIIYGGLMLGTFILYRLCTERLMLAILSNLSSIGFVLFVYEVSKKVKFANALTKFLGKIYYEIYLIHLILIKQFMLINISDIYKIIMVICLSILLGVVLKSLEPRDCFGIKKVQNSNKSSY